MAFSCKAVLAIFCVCFFQLSRSQIPPDYGPCPIGRYGDTCNQNCSSHCAGPCNVTNGDCLLCHGNFSPPNCTVCIENFYGMMCEYECSATCARSYEGRCLSCIQIKGCDRTTGSCTYGCKPELYGDTCQYRCPRFCAATNNYGEHNCERNNGSCPRGCYGPYYGEFCDKRCSYGCLGSICSQYTECEDNYFLNVGCTHCGRCANGTSCSNITGICPASCQLGWRGEECSVCDHGFYGNGDNCTACGHCEIGTTCDNITGQCPDGCQMRWQGTKCDECSAGYYGAKCSEQCGHCRNNDICLPSNGHCVYGCKREFDGDTCKDCKTGMKGDNCSYPCGSCGGDGSCAKQNGECFYGCRSGWEGKECLNKTILQAEDPEDHTWIIAGSVIGVGVLITCAIIVSVLVWLRKRRAASEIDETKKNNPHCLTNELQHGSEMNVKKDSTLESEKVEESTYDRLEVYENTDEEVKPYTHSDSRSHLTSFMEGDLPSAHYDRLTAHYQNSTENGKPYEALTPRIM